MSAKATGAKFAVTCDKVGIKPVPLNQPNVLRMKKKANAFPMSIRTTHKSSLGDAQMDMSGLRLQAQFSKDLGAQYVQVKNHLKWQSMI